MRACDGCPAAQPPCTLTGFAHLPTHLSVAQRASGRTLHEQAMTTLEASKPVRKTALNPVHRRLGAKMVDFGGWDMPVEYPTYAGRQGGLIAEHMAVRTGVGLFDVSHMGDIRVSGPQALAAIQHATMNDASALYDGRAQYSALLYPEGTFVDDIIVHKLADGDYLIVINAGTREKDVNWVKDAVRRFDCGSQTGSAGTNDQHIMFFNFVFAHNLKQLKI